MKDDRQSFFSDVLLPTVSSLFTYLETFCLFGIELDKNRLNLLLIVFSFVLTHSLLLINYN